MERKLHKGSTFLFCSLLPPSTLTTLNRLAYKEHLRNSCLKNSQVFITAQKIKTKQYSIKYRPTETIHSCCNKSPSFVQEYN